MRITSGSTAEFVYFVAVSASDHVTRVTDLTSFTHYASVNGSTGTLQTTGTITAVNSTQMPGVYKMVLTDSTVWTLPAGVDSREVCIHISSSMDPVTRTFELYRRTATTGQTLTLNTSGKIADVEATLAKVTSIDTDIDSALTLLTSINSHVTSADTVVNSVLTKLTSVETDVDAVLVKATSADANIALTLTKLTSVETDVDSVLTKVTSIDTDIDTALTRLTSIDTKATAIQAQTTQLTFTVANSLDSNIQYVNDVLVNGTGTTGNEWGP